MTRFFLTIIGCLIIINDTFGGIIMRVRNNFKENKTEEIKDRITATLLAVTLAVAPAAVVYKVEHDKLVTMSEFYQTLIEEEKQKSYLEGYMDGLFGIEDNFFTPVEKKIDDCIIEKLNLIKEIPEQESVKKLAYVKKNTKY